MPITPASKIVELRETTEALTAAARAKMLEAKRQNVNQKLEDLATKKEVEVGSWDMEPEIEIELEQAGYKVVHVKPTKFQLDNWEPGQGTVYKVSIKGEESSANAVARNRR